MKSCITIKRGPEIRITSETGAIDSTTVNFVKADEGIRATLNAKRIPCLLCFKSRASDYYLAVSDQIDDFAQGLKRIEGVAANFSAAVVGVCLDCMLLPDAKLVEAALKACSP